VVRPVTRTHDLGTQRHVLDDGRRVTLRHAVPSDAPRLTLLGSEFDGDDGRVALDDHGRIVGHAGHAAAPIVADDWVGSGLAPLLAGHTSDN
jgi:hypothetical protein